MKEAGRGARFLGVGGDRRGRRSLIGLIRSAGARKLGWAVTDQALSSFTNFAVGVLLARSLSPNDFGAFSLAFTTYILCVGACRSVATDALVARYGGLDRSQWAEGARAALGTAVAVGLLSGAGSLAASRLMTGSMRQAFLALGVLLPGLVVQECWRWAFFAAGRGGMAVVNDLAWAVVMFPALVLLTTGQAQSMVSLMLAWGGGATFGAVLGMLQARLVPRPSRAWRWVGQHRDLGFRYLAEFVTVAGSLHLLLYCVGAVAGLASAGAFRGTQIMLGPLYVVFVGVIMFAVPEGVRMIRSGWTQLLRVSMWLSTALATLSLCWVGFLTILPDSYGFALLGRTWVESKQLILPVGLSMVASAVAVGPTVGLRSLASARHSLRAQLVSGPLLLAGGLAGAFVGRAQGAALGMCIAGWIGAGAWWYQFRKATQQFATTSEPECADNDVLVTRT